MTSGQYSANSLSNKVLNPDLAAAAASEPACPAPTTITSYSFRNIFLYNLTWFRIVI
jgi:hypothetical protein